MGEGREKERGWSSPFGGQGWGPRVSLAHSALVNLKYKSEDVKCRKEKKKAAQKVSYRNQPRAPKQRSLGKGGGRHSGSFCSPVAGNVLI